MFGIPGRAERQEEIRTAVRDAMGTYGGWLYNFLGEGYGLDPQMGDEEALKIPALWRAVNLLAAELAAMPIKLHEGSTRAEIDSPVGRIVSKYPNPHSTSIEYRIEMWMDVFITGCHASWIERSANGQPRHLWRLDPTDLRVEYAKDSMEPVFKYRVGKRTGRMDYTADEIIYLTFVRRRDGLTPISPVKKFALALRQAISSMEYAIRLYENGGVPPLMLSGPMSTGAGLTRASEDMHNVIEDLSKEGRNVLPVPEGHELKELVIDPDRMQNLQQQEWSVRQVGRIYGVPISFLGDRTQATYSNIEQEDLNLVKHTLLRWAVLLEQQLNLKILGYNNTSQFFKHNMDAILRGDYKTRIEGNARAIQTGQMTPDEARALEDREPVDGGDMAYIQGATIPLKQSGTMPAKNTPKGEMTDD